MCNKHLTMQFAPLDKGEKRNKCVPYGQEALQGRQVQLKHPAIPQVVAHRKDWRGSILLWRSQLWKKCDKMVVGQLNHYYSPMRCTLLLPEEALMHLTSWGDKFMEWVPRDYNPVQSFKWIVTCDRAPWLRTTSLEAAPSPARLPSNHMACSWNEHGISQHSKTEPSRRVSTCNTFHQNFTCTAGSFESSKAISCGTALDFAST